jgi:hypothetical protein
LEYPQTSHGSHVTGKLSKKKEEARKAGFWLFDIKISFFLQLQKCKRKDYKSEEAREGICPGEAWNWKKDISTQGSL